MQLSRLPPGVPALLLFLLLFSLACLYGSTSFYRDPGSVFFDPSRAYERSYSLHRESEATQFRHAFEQQLKGTSNKADVASIHNVTKVGHNPKLCVAFVTVARDIAEQYIHLAVASALAGLTLAEREDLDVKIYFADSDAQAHPAWHSWLSHVADAAYSSRDIVSTEQVEQLRVLERAGNWQQKSGIDYAIALEACRYNSSAPYIAIIEEDGLVADGWMARTLIGLRDVERQMQELGREGQWLYMRLFNEERASGWASRDLLGNHVPLISFATAFILCFAILTFRHQCCRSHRHLDNPTIFVLCFVAVPAFIALFYQSGKASMLPPSAGARMEAFGCCTQGMVYPRAQVSEAIKSLKQQAITATPYDISLNNFAREHNLAQLALYPVQIQHLGFHSAISPGRKEDGAPWSMAYESLQPLKLQRDHATMVKELYGTTV